MRTLIYNFINGLNLGSFVLSNKLPWSDNGAPLYHHNKRHIYVDVAQVAQTSLYETLDGVTGAVNEITTVDVYFVNDAKLLPDNYDSLVNAIKGARMVSSTDDFISRTVQVIRSYEADAIITKLEFSFKKIITN
jgi:hypothetical protein